MGSVQNHHLTLQMSKSKESANILPLKSKDDVRINKDQT